MNTKILQKVLEELKKDKPSIDYLKGMIETLLEMSGGSVITYEQTIPKNLPTILSTEVDGREEIPDFLKPGPIGNIA